ncbi:MAG TPA: Lrp/AsnC family transcriptional regulator [Candidatus Dormibacteraeota bacterium]
MRKYSIDEVDVALLDALHVNPRASFERLGTALGITPVTAARRWRRLAASGRAWVSSVPGPRLAMTAAVCEIEACPGRAESVGRALAALPQVASVYLTDGEFGVHAMVFADDMTSLSMLLLDEIPRVPGVIRGRSHIGVEWFSGVRWRLGAISSDQQRSVTGAEAGEDRNRGSRTRVFDAPEHALYLALQHDGRASFRDLARALDTPEHQVRRRMASLVRRGMLSFRTDFARGEGGWPAELVLWLAVPCDQLEQVGLELGGWPETRVCMSTVGTANVLLMAQVHQLSDLGRILERLRTAFHAVRVCDQRVVLRPLKSWGRLLDPAGHATGVVPVDPWAPSAAAFSQRNR